jgi:hypothetical protein
MNPGEAVQTVHRSAAEAWRSRGVVLVLVLVLVMV